MMTLSGKERVLVFAIGFGLGLLLIGFIHNRRAAQGPEGTESMTKKVIRDVVSSTGIKPLPEGTPEILRESRLHSFDVITSGVDGSSTTIWNLEMNTGMWPWVRVSSKQPLDLTQAPEVLVVAGDRILVKLKEGRTEEDLMQLIAEAGMSHLGFYKSTQQYVIGVEPGMPLSIPFSVSRLERAVDIVEHADYHTLKYF